jgi:Peptidase inhibitor family I36
MAARSRLRFAALLLAVSGLVVGVGVLASASASGNPSAATRAGTIAKTAAKKHCPRRTVCLYSKKNFQGEQRRYYCRGFRKGEEREAPDLGQQWTTRAGVSSFENNGVPFARLWFKFLKPVDHDSLVIKPNSRANIEPERYDDMAVSLDVTC